MSMPHSLSGTFSFRHSSRTFSGGCSCRSYGGSGGLGFGFSGRLNSGRFVDKPAVLSVGVKANSLIVTSITSAVNGSAGASIQF